MSALAPERKSCQRRLCSLKQPELMFLLENVFVINSYLKYEVNVIVIQLQMRSLPLESTLFAENV